MVLGMRERWSEWYFRKIILEVVQKMDWRKVIVEARAICEEDLLIVLLKNMTDLPSISF